MSNEDLFHLGIKALIRNSKGQILILKANTKTYDKPTPNHWDLPGGRVQKGDDIEKTLQREVEEEIGIKKFKILKLLDASISKMRISYQDLGLILFTYLCSINNTDDIKLIDDEHTEFQWVSPKQAAQLLRTKFSDSLVEVVKKLA